MFLPKLIEDGIISKDGAYHKFERAISGCIDGCPECVVDTGNSIFGPFLTSDHTDNRLSALYLLKAGQTVGTPSVYFANSQSEIRALKLGIAEGEGITLAEMEEWVSGADVKLNEGSVEVETAFLFDPTN